MLIFYGDITGVFGFCQVSEDVLIFVKSNDPNLLYSHNFFVISSAFEISTFD